MDRVYGQLAKTEQTKWPTESEILQKYNPKHVQGENFNEKEEEGEKEKGEDEKKTHPVHPLNEKSKTMF